jgi:hypothetical protein
MTNRTRARLAALVVAVGCCGCGSATPSPAAPSGALSASATPPPPGSLFMRGTVSDRAFRHLAGAVVEVLDGPQAGLSTTSDARGQFSFTGVFDDTTRFRATKEGHITAIQTLGPFCAPCNPNRWVNFALEVLDSPTISMAGDYTMTFVADANCTMLPENTRSRTFTATISPAQNVTSTNPHFTIRVGGATFLEGWDSVAMGVAGNYVAFWLETLVERIAPTALLTFAGQAAASVDTSDLSTIALRFDGSIEYCVTGSEQDGFPACFRNQAVTRARCDSNNHQLILTRR